MRHSRLHDLSPVLLVSGGPAAGKTTLSRQLAGLVNRPAIVSLDALYGFTLRNERHPPSVAERSLILTSAALLASVLVQDGYQVIVEGVVPPGLVEVPAGVLHDLGIRVSLVVLGVPVAEALVRNQRRSRVLHPSLVREVHRLFLELGSFRKYRVKSTSVVLTCRRVLCRWRLGSLELEGLVSL